MFKPTKPQHIVNKAYADNNSGGGGNSEPLVVTFTWDDQLEYGLSDKTYGEVRRAFESNRPIIFHCDTQHIETVLSYEVPILNGDPGYQPNTGFRTLGYSTYPMYGAYDDEKIWTMDELDELYLMYA